jgi:hypothetical protein
VNINSITKVLYGTARFLRWVQAIGKGPSATAKRGGRVVAGRITGSWINRMFR